ncbi:MAG: hypothetical protein M3O15_07790 [Acidobacteriota bacterium]|nr:hypothetical protein [Acidobacteriota bacterium]
MHIVFLTLFIGLIRGVRPVTLDASGAVASIEIVLDGRGVRTLRQAPWTAEVDFGPSLLPHHLEARGLAADGTELARTEQWVNLPQPPVEAEIAIEDDVQGKSRIARIAWQSLSGDQPLETRLSLDGAPLALDSGGRARLPAAAPGSVHVLTAELRFASGDVARKDVVVSGELGSDVRTELTAVPVEPREPRAPLTPQDLQGLFTAAGQPLHVTTVEQGPAHVFVVREPGVEILVNRFLSYRQVAGMRIPKGLLLPAGVEFYFADPVASIHRHGDAQAEIFDILRAAKGAPSFGSLLTAASSNGRNDRSRPQVADAVAVAGLHAAAGQTPRAVLLILGRQTPNDASHFDPAAVREYLAALGVPLFVWRMDQHGAPRAAWGEVEAISSSGSMAAAYDRLLHEVGTQRIVWVEGRYLPQSISLAPARGGDKSLKLLVTPSPPGEPGSKSVPQSRPGS